MVFVTETQHRIINGLGVEPDLTNSSPPFYDFSNCSATSVNTISETIVGSTTYDLQTNASVMDRILMHDDGSISLANSYPKYTNHPPQNGIFFFSK